MSRYFKLLFTIFLFLLLEGLAVAAFLSRKEVNYVGSLRYIGWFYNSVEVVQRYFYLQYENRDLLDEVSRLQESNLILAEKNALLMEKLSVDSSLYDFGIDSTALVIPASISLKTILKQDNLFLVNKGSNDSVKMGMSVVRSGAIIGHIIDVKTDYAVVRSLLSKRIKVSAELKKNSSFCSVGWGGDSPYELEFTEMTKYSDAMVGDTIVVANFSNSLIGGSIVGTISEMKLEKDMYFVGKVVPLVDFKDIKSVSLIENLHLKVDSLVN